MCAMLVIVVEAFASADVEANFIAEVCATPIISALVLFFVLFSFVLMKMAHTQMQRNQPARSSASAAHKPGRRQKIPKKVACSTHGTHADARWCLMPDASQLARFLLVDTGG